MGFLDGFVWDITGTEARLWRVVITGGHGRGGWLMTLMGGEGDFEGSAILAAFGRHSWSITGVSHSQFDSTRSSLLHFEEAHLG